MCKISLCTPVNELVWQVNEIDVPNVEEVLLCYQKDSYSQISKKCKCNGQIVISINLAPEKISLPR